MTPLRYLLLLISFLWACPGLGADVSPSDRVTTRRSKYSCGFPMVIFQQPTQAFFTAD